jgi:probable rRNA maturation factor
LRLQISAEQGDRFTPYLRRHLRAAHAILRPELRELSLAMVGDATMVSLHEEFLGIPGPTDVLTFELEHDSRGRVISGEVVICVPEARRQAKKRRSPVERELLLYALHGMLHLIGFDDRTDVGYRKMHEKEDEVLTELGAGPVFAASRHAATGVR